jgi:hypothetical protein
MVSGAALALALAAALASARGAAPQEGPLRVLVAVNSDRERLFAARVEGQTTDLDVAIIVAELGPGLDPDRLAAAAGEEAQARGAEVAVWFVTEGDDWIVNVSRGERTIRRLVVEPKGALSASASMEAVALVVRSSLRGVVVGEEVPEDPPPEPPLSFLAELGWAAAMDRAWSSGHHGVEVRVGVKMDHWRIALLLEEHPPETIVASDVTVRLERQLLAVVFGYGFRFASRWRFGVALGAELFRFQRITSTVADGLLATGPQVSVIAGARPELDLTFRLVWSLWVYLRIGGDFLIEWPQLMVRRDGATRAVVSLWRVQPTAAVGLRVEVP